jgi:Flp pilus assembly pilin Flp
MRVLPPIDVQVRFLAMIHLLDGEGGQGMVEYLLIVSLVVLTIVGLFVAVRHLFS